LGIYKLAVEIERSKTDWLQYLEGIENCRLLKCTLHYKPIKRRGMERLRKIWEDR
jgi:hypothetical protein